MNKEQQELLDKVYKKYRSKSKDIDLPENLYNKLIDDLNKDAMFPIDNPNRMLTKEEFINKCKTNPEFSERWGLKIKERELNVDELNIVNLLKQTSTKLITITYNDKTLESYE
jgi:hypothetical protein